MSTNIKRALFACQKALPSVDRDGTNVEGGYAFTKADTLIEAVRTVTLSNGLSIRRPSAKLRYELTKPVAVSTFEIFHEESGDLERHEFEIPVFAEAGQDFDKAFLAALTTAWAYWLRDLLALPRRDGVEVDTRAPAPAAPASAPRTAAAAPPPATPEPFDAQNPRHRQRLERHFHQLGVRTMPWKERLYRALDGTPDADVMARLEREVSEARERMAKEPRRGGGGGRW